MKRKLTATLIIIFGVLSLTSQKFDKVLTGKVTRVTDGDTFILNNNITVRLWGIDCPEKGQDYSKAATRFLLENTANCDIRVEWHSRDQYRRILGIVYACDLNINETMLASGYAWQYNYNHNKRYSELQLQAQQQRCGLWKQKSPLPPWEYRKQQKKSKSRKPAARNKQKG